MLSVLKFPVFLLADTLVPGVDVAAVRAVLAQAISPFPLFFHRWKGHHLRAFACAALPLLVALSTQPASARDRPGTPNNLELRDCGIEGNFASICGSFANTAHGTLLSSEEVRIESELTEEGHAVSPPVSLGCQNHYLDRSNPNVQEATCILSIFKYADGQFQIRGAKFSTNYCIRLRARRTSDQVVSAQWSAAACLTTRAIPAAPKAPNFEVQYFGPPSEFSNGVQMKQRPTEVRVNTIPQPDTVSVLAFNGDTFWGAEDNAKHWTYIVKPGDDLLRIEICNTNAAGKNCGSEVVSIVHQWEVEVNGVPVRHTGTAANPNGF